MHIYIGGLTKNLRHFICSPFLSCFVYHSVAPFRNLQASVVNNSGSKVPETPTQVTHHHDMDDDDEENGRQ